MSKTIYILSHGNTLRKCGKRLILQGKEKKIFEIPCHEVARILIYGRTEVTSQTISGILQHNIPIYYLKKSGSLKGKILPQLDSRVHWRYLQYRQLCNTKYSIHLAKKCINAKLHNMQKMIAHITRRGRGTAKLCEPLKRAQKSLQKCKRQEEIMGVEGIAAKHYFQIYGQSLPPEFTFTTRSRRPAQDNANALLNLGYMTLFREITAVIEAHGLDPYLGFLHSLKDGRASLALDILEEFRQPFIDLFIYKIITTKQITDEHFTNESADIQINNNGFGKFFKLYEENMGSDDGESPGIRKMIDTQVIQLKKFLEEKSAYTPFKISKTLAMSAQ